MDQMRLIGFMEANFFALIVLLIIYLNTRKYSYRYAYEQKLYTYLIFSNAFMLTVDIVRMYVDGKSGVGMYRANLIGAILMFTFTPIVSMIWSVYIDYKVFIDRKKAQKKFKHIALVSFVNFIVLLLGLFGLLNGKAIFHIGADNIYARGELHKVPIILSYVYIIYSVLLIKFNKDIIDEADYKSFRMFAVPPFIGGILQSMVYGLKLAWISLTLSLFIIFLYVQNNLLHVDVLTGLYNRRNLEKYLKNILSQSSKSKIIGGVLLDINDFKDINDTYGHDEGDRALIAIAKILKDAFNREDFVSRYAGDEFVVVCEVESYEELRGRIKNLKKNIDKFNETSGNPYDISISKGYDMFVSNSGVTEEGFINLIDSLMYEDKERYREEKSILQKESPMCN